MRIILGGGIFLLVDMLIKPAMYIHISPRKISLFSSLKQIGAERLPFYDADIIPLYDGYELDIQSTGYINSNGYHTVYANFLIDLFTTNSDTNIMYQNFVIYFTGVRVSPVDISFYNPDFSTQRNPYQRVSYSMIGQTFPKTFEGDNFCIAFTIQHYITHNWLKEIENCHLIILPKFHTYPYLLINTLVSTNSLDAPASMKVEYI
jgi:hypothetical protein